MAPAEQAPRFVRMGNVLLTTTLLRGRQADRTRGLSRVPAHRAEAHKRAAKDEPDRDA
jgi:hypothetical protein